MMEPGKIKSRLVKALLKPINTAAVILLGAMTFVWGLWIWFPMWSVFASAQLYSWMAILPEWVWGLQAMIIGAVMIYGVLKRSFSGLLRGARLGFYHWLVIGIMYFGGDWQNTGWIVSIMLAAYCSFIWINLEVNKDSLADDDNPDDLLD